MGLEAIGFTFFEDEVNGKPNSLKASMDMIPDTILPALEGKQIQPILVSLP
jgi:dipicolinate synthase subunit B